MWEVSTDGGGTWEAITSDPAATPSADGLTLSVVGSESNTGFWYRATASNSAGEMTSEAAKLTVTAKSTTVVDPEPTDPDEQTEQSPTGQSPSDDNQQADSPGLPATGTESTLVLVAALAALVLGTGILAKSRVNG